MDDVDPRIGFRKVFKNILPNFIGTFKLRRLPKEIDSLARTRYQLPKKEELTESQQQSELHDRMFEYAFRNTFNFKIYMREGSDKIFM